MPNGSAKKILLIGGGTGGHILSLRNLVNEIKKRGYKTELIVSDANLDRTITNKNFTDIPIHYFKTGKIRRYLSFQNFIDFFRIIKSFFQAKKLLKKIKPDIIFFKGGFVGFPFLVATKFIGRFQGPIYSHESDISPGMLTRMLEKYSDRTFSNFGEPPMPLFYQPNIKTIQPNISNPNKIKKILILGGSLGAEFLNKIFEQNSKKICKKYFVTLISGINKKINFQHKNFEQHELLPVKNLAQKINDANLVISRAGSNSLAEIISAKKPCIAIPLPSAARNHQFLNAQYYKKKKLCAVLEQNNKTAKNLYPTIEKVINDKTLINSLHKFNLKNASQEIAEIICKY